MAKLKAKCVNSEGTVTGYLLGNGRPVTMAQAVRMATQNVKGVRTILSSCLAVV